jgi:hypothetical protein
VKTRRAITSGIFLIVLFSQVTTVQSFSVTLGEDNGYEVVIASEPSRIMVVVPSYGRVSIDVCALDSVVEIPN